MKNRVFTITKDNINTGDIQIVNTEMHVQTEITTLSGRGAEDTILYPGQIYAKNNTGALLYYNTFYSSEEYNHYIEDPQWYDLLPWEDGELLTNPNSLRIWRIIFKIYSYSPPALSDLTIQCINYRIH